MPIFSNKFFSCQKRSFVLWAAGRLAGPGGGGRAARAARARPPCPAGAAAAGGAAACWAARRRLGHAPSVRHRPGARRRRPRGPPRGGARAGATVAPPRRAGARRAPVRAAAPGGAGARAAAAGGPRVSVRRRLAGARRGSGPSARGGQATSRPPGARRRAAGGGGARARPRCARSAVPRRRGGLLRLWAATCASRARPRHPVSLPSWGRCAAGAGRGARVLAGRALRRGGAAAPAAACARPRPSGARNAKTITK